MRQHTVQTPYMVGEAHFYTAEINGELVLFDTGPATPEAIVCLKENVDLTQLKHLFVTHCHVDHYGLSAYISQNSAATVYLPKMDDAKFRFQSERLAGIEHILVEHGFDREYVRNLRDIFEKNKIFPTLPDRYAIVEESEALQRLGISWTACPGHSQSDLVYIWNGNAVTGDILLRDIFQAPLLDLNLKTLEGRFRNYDAYCASLLKLHGLNDYTIRPGHRGYIKSVDGAILFYAKKLMERALLVKRLNSVESVYEVIRQLFGDNLKDPFLIYLKACEIVFMRDFLAEPERLKSSLEQIGMFEGFIELYSACC